MKLLSNVFLVKPVLNALKASYAPARVSHSTKFLQWKVHFSSRLTSIPCSQVCATVPFAHISLHLAVLRLHLKHAQFLEKTRLGELPFNEKN